MKGAALFTELIPWISTTRPSASTSWRPRRCSGPATSGGATDTTPPAPDGNLAVVGVAQATRPSALNAAATSTIPTERPRTSVTLPRPPVLFTPGRAVRDVG
jgi:hypothetical protein